MIKEKGQVILILILVMTVALSIGLSIVQKSLVDVSTASKVEQSSRAFSAAEAGIEKALKGDASCNDCQTFTDNSSSIKQITGAGADLIPVVPAASDNQQQDALEYPPLAKEDVAQFWLADPNTLAESYMPGSKTCSPGTTCRGIEIYWGSPNAEKAALEVKIIYYDGTAYKTVPYYFESDASRYSGNGFTNASGNCSSSPTLITTTTGTNRRFYCRKLITSSFPTSGLMLVRTRLLYNSTSQPVAVRGYGTCGPACSLPPQAKLITSTGTSGETQRKIQLFQLYRIVPPFFDYAIFSAGAISK